MLATITNTKETSGLDNCGPIWVNQSNGRQILMVDHLNTSAMKIALYTLGAAWDAALAVRTFEKTLACTVAGESWTDGRFLKGVCMNADGDKIILGGHYHNTNHSTPVPQTGYAARIDLSQSS